MFVVIGGDYLCVIGMWFGVVDVLWLKGLFGLIWIDVYFDSYIL